MSNNDSIIFRIFENAKRFGDKEALIAGQRRVTYEELVRNVMSVAEMWRSDGIKSGDSIMLGATSTPTFVFGYFAAHLLSAKAVLVDPSAPHRRLAFIVEQTNPKAIYLPKPFTSGKFVGETLNRLEDLPSAIHRFEFPDPDSAADVIFTTGTTGTPKGVVLSHKNLCAAADNINAFVGTSEYDREVLPQPLCHSFGLGRLRCVMSAGGTLVLVNGFINVGGLFQAISDEGATGLCFVPAGLALIFRMTGDQLGKFSDQIKYIEIGSAPMPIEHKLELMRLMPDTRICMHYGLTEASRSAFIEFHADKEYLQSVGRPTPNVEIRIAGPDGEVLAENQTGEIQIRGAHVMHGYWKGDGDAGAVTRDGWLSTGDIGFTDAAGYLHLRGREKEMINVGGRNVVPMEVEAVLAGHQAIAECACIGVADPQGISGEIVKAYLVPGGPERPEMRELDGYIRDKLEPYKRPSMYEWIRSIPKTESGKIQRQLLTREKHTPARTEPPFIAVRDGQHG